MAAIFGFIKTHLISLLSGIAIIACVVVATMGMGSKTVIEAMEGEKRRVGASSIRSLQSNPKNQSIIDAEEKRVAKFKNEYEATLEAAREFNARKPIMEGVFPKPRSSSTPLRFVEAYKQRLEQLPRRLGAGTLPTADDIAEEEQNVQDLLALEAEQEAETAVEDGGGRQPAATRGGRPGMRPGTRPGPDTGGMRPTAGVRGGMGGMQPGGMRPGMRPTAGVRGGMGGMQPGGGGRMTGGMPGRSSAGMRAPNSEPKYNALFRARVNKALGINCYVEDYMPNQGRISQSFHVSPIIYADSAPPTEEMWYAQMSMWVQEDVVAAIAALNDEAAASAPDGDATVAQMPVKRVKSLRVVEYVLDKENQPFPTNDTTGSSRTAVNEGTFTDRMASDLYDVIRFNMTVVVTQRDLNRLVDKICTTNLAICTGMRYFAVDRDVDETSLGYFYGPAPVVEAELEFEAYYLRSAYEPMMPDSIATVLGITREGGDDD